MNLRLVQVQIIPSSKLKHQLSCKKDTRQNGVRFCRGTPTLGLEWSVYWNTNKIETTGCHKKQVTSFLSCKHLAFNYFMPWIVANLAAKWLCWDFIIPHEKHIWTFDLNRRRLGGYYNIFARKIINWRRGRALLFVEITYLWLRLF